MQALLHGREGARRNTAYITGSCTTATGHRNSPPQRSPECTQIAQTSERCSIAEHRAQKHTTLAWRTPRAHSGLPGEEVDGASAQIEQRFGFEKLLGIVPGQTHHKMTPILSP